MGFLSVISYAHKLVQERVQSGDCVIDATVGGGNDTLFLARAVGPKGQVYGFDIQAEALDRARSRIIGELGEPRVTGHIRLIHQSHADIAAVLPSEQHGKVAAVMFNLGYLPGGDQSLITETESTLDALQASLHLLRPGGIVTIVVYPGHPGGDVEAEAVTEWSAALEQRAYQTLLYRFANVRSAAPYLIAIEKR